MKHIFIFFIRVYQKFFSGLKKRPCCRFYPTCSAYAVEAFKIHGVFKGGALTIWRLLRCQPFAKGGVDLVPEKKIKVKKPIFQDGEYK